jgi:hypothetical protein
MELQKMRNKMMNFVLTALGGTLLISMTACAAPKAKIIAKVIDSETGKPIQGAKVSLGFVYESSWGKYKSDKQIGNTNKEGIFSGAGSTRQDTIVKAYKSGYYESWHTTLDDNLKHNKLLNRWEPYPCEIIVKLRRIKDSVPMFVKKTGWIKVPEQNKSIGYDLKIGDWVAPHGEGKISDLLMKESHDLRSALEADSKVTIIFKDGNDGIIEFDSKNDEQSIFKHSYLAPLSGYKKQLKKIKNFKDGGLDSNIKQRAEYLFRVRTKKRYRWKYYQCLLRLL